MHRPSIASYCSGNSNYTFLYNEKYFSDDLSCPNLEGMKDALFYKSQKAHDWSDLQCRVHKQGWP